MLCVTFEGELQVFISGGIMETFFVRSSMNKTTLDHWIAGKEAPIFPFLLPNVREIPPQWSICGEMLGNMVDFFPNVGLIGCSLVQLAYKCDPALD